MATPGSQAESPQQAPPPPQVDYQLLRLYIDSIPKYDGNPFGLNTFIGACDNLINNFYHANRETLNNFMYQAIMGKLIGKAQMVAGSRIEVRTWLQVKEILRINFGDQRNIKCLELDLLNLKISKNENFHSFGLKCQELRSLLISKLIHSDKTYAEKEFYSKHYEQMALDTFTRSLSPMLQFMIRVQAIDSLEVAINRVNEEENFSNYTKSFQGHNFVTKSEIQKPFIPPTQIKQPQYNFTPRPTVGYAPNYTYNPQIQNPFKNQNFQSPKPSFPSQPINLQQKQLPNQKFLTNTKVFGKPKNVFDPKNVPSKPLFKPTPMSTTSANTVPRQHHAGFFQSTGPRNWAAQELHNIKEDEEYDEEQLHNVYEEVYGEEISQSYGEECLTEEYYEALQQQQEVNFPTATNQNNPT